MSNRNVRLGIVYRGSIIHEEIIDRRIDVSIGLRAGSTIQFSAKDYPDFPDHIDVLYCEADKYNLVVPSDPTARVNLRGAALSNVQQVRGKRCVPVEEAAGGSIIVGDVTIMFQFVKGYVQHSITHERTVLRIGLVFDDRLISDKIFPDEKQVSVGGTNADSVVLDQVDYTGPSIKFSNNKDGSVTLLTPKDVKVRIAVQDDAPRDLKELMAKGKAREEGGNVICHLTLGTRGRASLGPYTVLFQVVRQRVVVPQMDRKSFGQRFIALFMQDVVWTTCFGISALVGLGVVIQAKIYQQNAGQYLTQAKQEEQAKETYEVILEEKEEIKPEEPEPEDPKETVEIQAEKPKDEPKAKPDKPDKAPAVDQPKPTESLGKTVDPTEQKKAVVAAVEQKTILGALSAGGATSKLFGEAADGEAGDVNANRAFGSGEGDGAAAGPGKGGLNLAGGGGGGGTVEKVKGGGGGGFKRDTTVAKPVAAEKKEASVKVTISSGALGGSGEAKSEIGKIIGRKNSAVQRCYETGLRDNPNLSGKVTVQFTVGTGGTITSVNVMGASGEFADCIKSKFMNIRGLPLLASPQSFTQGYVFTKS